MGTEEWGLGEQTVLLVFAGRLPWERGASLQIRWANGSQLPLYVDSFS